MLYTVKWWRDELKPVGIEYRSLDSFNEIQLGIRELIDESRAKRVEVFDHSGDLVARYPKSRRG